MTMAAALLVLLLAVPTVYGVDHVVGGNAGWTQGQDYTTWASGETFNAGDNLVFNYGFTHSVAEVNKADYDACSSSNALQTYTGGSNTVPLTTSGTKYYICPTAGHCGGGMKLAITVAATSGGSPPSTPTTPSTPSTPSTPTTPSGSTPTTPSSKTHPPGGNGAGSVVGTVSNVVVLGSAAVVLAAIFGYM